MNHFIKNKIHLLALCLLVLSCAPGIGQHEGQVVQERFHSKSLENTVTKESPDRTISVYLPPSYLSSKEKKYPVVYLLHGIAGTDDDWVRSAAAGTPYLTIKSVMDKGISAGKFGEMIIVMPDESTNWFGSFYVNSSVTGNWEDFTTSELVSFIDNKYRTLSSVESRGIAGHSMGGYGAITLGMKRPDVYSVVYAFSPALIDFTGDMTIAQPGFQRALESKSFDELRQTQDFMTMGAVCVAQAFSPNPTNPPFYADLPFKKEGNKMIPNPRAFAQWREHSPLRMVEKYRSNLSKLKGINLDVGDQDEFLFIILNSRAFSVELTNNGIEHIFEEYSGDHRNQIWGINGRLYNKLLPYFWKLLSHN